MSHIVTCPNCEHVFEVDELFEKCEGVIEKITGGHRTKTGSAGVDVIGLDGTSYQVKHSKIKKDNRNWEWEFSINHVEPDFAAVFGLYKTDEFLFLLDYATVKRMSSMRITPTRRNSIDSRRLHASYKINSWIWDYRVSPENFMARVAELKASQQLAMGFTKGLGD